jgi:hypothetical protein
MARGSAPGPIAVTLNSVLAVSFILGFQMFGANEGSAGPALPQIGAWLWLASFAPGLIAGLSSLRRQPIAST